MSASLSPAVYDAGALVAAERGDDRLQELHLRYLRHDLAPRVPTPVSTQVWRGGAKQARVSMVLRGCILDSVDESTAKRAGVLLGRSGTVDAVDALVVAVALAWDALVVTSDPADVQRLIDVARAERPPPVIGL